MPRPFPKCEKVRPFDQVDWCGFAGAEKFADGGDPLIGDAGDEVLFLACRTRIEIHVNSLSPAWEEGEAYYYPVDFPTQKGAEIFLKALPQTWEEIEAMGFLPLD